jgi:carbohydrate-selective porin OprB
MLHLGDVGEQQDVMGDPAATAAALTAAAAAAATAGFMDLGPGDLGGFRVRWRAVDQRARYWGVVCANSGLQGLHAHSTGCKLLTIRHVA